MAFQVDFEDIAEDMFRDSRTWRLPHRFIMIRHTTVERPEGFRKCVASSRTNLKFKEYLVGSNKSLFCFVFCLNGRGGSEI